MRASECSRTINEESDQDGSVKITYVQEWQGVLRGQRQMLSKN